MLFGPLRTVDLCQRRYGMDYYSSLPVIPVRIHIREIDKIGYEETSVNC